ncbi:triose-phosphate isomerase [Deinococcus cellulosilyticus]|uniref:Triosephosphate isomerase n=1 Tax=Deinococcus cellulosilyticus (strain DSM 18568 / NBRC 106333 / KACC 11606 / 5516J-15) TaxID=1223518 RepID=A0A511N754_DEIC1|nr:triose-phosphate isomerase [Deinococcus cellulosilyticus]GEM48296.1 triosephosphate isomerase [Deinococcus cellulosilyticus NBRC 106333 = KACC 11606]
MTKPQTFLALNWKMNKTPSESVQWAEELLDKLGDLNIKLAIMAPSVSLAGLSGVLGDAQVGLGAQDISQHESGAYTGEVSAAMLKDLGVQYAVIGHSERREYHFESDAVVAAKAVQAIKNGIVPIVCVGEKLPEREKGEHVSYTLNQLRGSLAGVELKSADDLVIAYEPVWAIGTGKTATAQDAEELCAAIRGVLKELYPQFADQIVVQYGGSVKPDNISEICSQPNVNGALVGGASLQVAGVVGMVEALK